MSKSINLYTKRSIQFRTLETSTSWVLVAVVVEQRGNETRVISEPRVIKEILKSPTLLSIPQIQKSQRATAVVSPYFSLFTETNAGILTWFGAQPPTK